MPPGTHDIRSSDRLAVPWRGGMHGTQPETREQIEQSFTHGAVHRREEAVIERCSIARLEPNGEAKFVHIASRHARPVVLQKRRSTEIKPTQWVPAHPKVL